MSYIDAVRRFFAWLVLLPVLASVACGKSHEPGDGSVDAGSSDSGHPPGPLGAACAGDSDCEPGLQCYTLFDGVPECPEVALLYRLPGGYCTVSGREPPGSDAVCPAGSRYAIAAACVSPTTVPYLYYCATTCTSDADCRTPDYFCDTTYWHICLPDTRHSP